MATVPNPPRKACNECDCDFLEWEMVTWRAEESGYGGSGRVMMNEKKGGSTVNIYGTNIAQNIYRTETKQST